LGSARRNTLTRLNDFLPRTEAMTTTAERSASPTGRAGDKVFKGLAAGAGVLILIALAGVGIFLLLKGFPALTASKSELHDAASENSFVAYVWPLVFGTLLAAALALIIATPLSIGVALFVSHYAPRRIATAMGYLIDLLAAVPSVVYGLWGIFFLAPRLTPFYEWLESHLGFIPLFSGPTSVTGRTMLTVGIVLAIMILPISTALNREVFLQTPRLHQEAALALGATRWEMIRMTVFPYARSGMVSASMLGLGRALGETMAVAMILSVADIVTFDLIGTENPATIAANIALKFPEASGLEVNLLIASGLVLFIITFAVNFLARSIVARRKEFSGAN
jgi:phosphate transport system permease protein